MYHVYFIDTQFSILHLYARSVNVGLWRITVDYIQRINLFIYNFTNNSKKYTNSSSTK